MEKFELQLKKERSLYRELFINAEKTFKELIKKMKLDFSCINCKTCCRLRYSNLSPVDIFRLANNENDEISKEYIKFFVPYGTDRNFQYTEDYKISFENNNRFAKEAAQIYSESSYAEKLILKHSGSVYFYYCRNLDENNNCTKEQKSFLCENFPNSISTILPENCTYRHWQNLVLHRIKTEIEPDIQLKIREILDYKNNFHCKRTGTCCRLASSEFSYEELKQKASNNDEFAKQFTGVFVPYTSTDEAQKVFPEYVSLLLERFDNDENINFFYCKHLKGENECPIYDDRPQICRDFPDNPLAIIPSHCGYYAWKDEVLVASYTFHAMSQIYDFYQEKIRDAIE